jgi:hypothetical protein
LTEIIVRKDDEIPVVKMITPGRRAYGEDWSEVTISHDGNDIHVTTEPHEAPADGKPIIVPLNGRGRRADAHNNTDMANFILDKYMGLAAERARRPDQGMTHQEKYDLMNKWFHDWMGEKIAHLQGRSSFGPGGSVQRQRINRSSNYDHRRFDN